MYNSKSIIKVENVCKVLTIIYSWENEIYFKYKVTGCYEVKGIDLHLQENYWKDI